MNVEQRLVAAARELYGARLHGMFLFGSRIAGTARPDSDLDVGVWLEGPLTRRTTWVPWASHFERDPLDLDPTFFTVRTLEEPSGWLLEAVHQGTRVVWDPSGELAVYLREIRTALNAGTYRRRLFMGLPYFERGAS